MHKLVQLHGDHNTSMLRPSTPEFEDGEFVEE